MNLKHSSMMKILANATLISIMISCGLNETNKEQIEVQPEDAGQSLVKDETSQPNVVLVAVGSKDHTTLVTALKAAGYVDELSNAGPFTVFAPVNSAFEKLPEGTVENLLKPDNKENLRNILEYHVYVGMLQENFIRDGMTLNQVNLSNVSLGKKGSELTVNGAKVLGSVKASNGIVYVIDQVLLPPNK